jgi:hypothetical protein
MISVKEGKSVRCDFRKRRPPTVSLGEQWQCRSDAKVLGILPLLEISPFLLFCSIL